ncbi:MAG: class I SAM-dependent methyltransferase, partial [Planctomycetota bacterium]
MSRHKNPFDRSSAEAVAYDAWYDTPEGRSVLRTEERCIRELLDGAPRPWLDVGTGSGRFGGDIGADVGLDPALELVKIASRRMPSVVRGTAEMLPLREASIGAVLSVAVFEFLAEPARAMREVARVLHPGGRFVLGFVPRGSAWAAVYEQQGR